MAKQDEKKYYERLGKEGQLHADGKPFTDAERGQLLIEIGQILALLPPPPAKVLDVGCGTGWTSEFLARSGYTVTGIDISVDMVQAAKRRRPHENLAFVVGDFENMPIENGFDAAVCFSSLHHCDNLTAALTGCKRALKPNGILILMEPGEGHSEAESSIKCAHDYGLTERSLPPKLLRSTLYSLGYTEVQAFPWLGQFSSALSLTPPSKNWKYRLTAFLTGRRVADSLQWINLTRKCAVIVARA
jgi:ubiquinone/menaquinone biosynthesis C-methylase UbiE